MSFADGWAALHLEMPKRVPRTEYSAEFHWDLIRRVTGIDVTAESPEADRDRASRAFERAWNYDYIWRTSAPSTEYFGQWQTDMGHAIYQANGSDYRQPKPCPFQTAEDVLNFDFDKNFRPYDRAEFIRTQEERYLEKCLEHPASVVSAGIYHTLISGFIQIFGWDMLLLAAGTDPDAFGELANRYARWNQPFFEGLAEITAPVIMVHNDMVWTSGAFIHPDWYRKYVFPNYKRYFEPMRDAGKIVLFTSDGNYTAFIDDIAASGVSGFCMEPTTDMAYIAEKYGRTHSFIGNADCRILLSGTKEEIRAEVERCMKIGKSCPGFIMAVGNHVRNTPVENAIYYNEVYEELSKR